MNIVSGPTKLGWKRVPWPLKVVVYAAALAIGLVLLDLTSDGYSSVDPATAVLAVALLLAAGGVWLERRFPRALVTVMPAVLHLSRLAVGDVGWRQWQNWVYTAVQIVLLWWFLYFNDVVDDYYIMLRDATDRQRGAKHFGQS